MTADRAIAPAGGPEQQWWDATRVRCLVVQCCAACGHLQHPPRSICLRCMGCRLTFRAMSGRGTVDSFTTVHRSPGPGFDPPYVVARIRLAEGPLLLSNLVGPGGHRCGAAVVLGWQALPDGLALPVFSTAPTDPTDPADPADPKEA